MENAQRKPYVVNSVQIDADRVKVFSLDPKDGRNIAFQPGQFVKLYDEKGEKFRPYSIASSPEENNLDFLIKMVGGEFTTYLDTVKVGTTLYIEGPLGHFKYKYESGTHPKCGFIAGGTGIAPILSILHHIRKNNIRGDFVFFYSIRTKADILQKEKLANLGREIKNLKIVYTLTRETPEGWKGELGRIDQKMFERNCPDASERNWFMCGPLVMVTELKKILVGLGVQEQNVKFEGWG